MRAPFLMLPIALALAAPLAAGAQDMPRVLFCAGGCFAVDANGARTPAPKGTPLLPGQRLETAAGGYAQVKLSPEAAVGIGEGARVRFDRDAVVLDHGRVRLVGGEAFGKPIGRPVELRTTDGTLVLRGGDVEARKTADIGLKSAPTLVKLNAGDARLGIGSGQIPLPKEGVQGITRGKLAGAPIPITDFVPPTRVTTVAVADRAPVATPTLPVIIPTTLVQQPLILDTTLTRTLTTSLSPTITYTATKPPISSADTLLNTRVLNPDTGTLTKVTDVLKLDTNNLSLQPKIYEAPKTDTTLQQVKTCFTCTQTFTFTSVRP